MCAVQGCGTSTVRYKGAVQVLCGTSVRYKYYTSNLTGPRAHNIIYFNIMDILRNINKNFDKKTLIK